MSHLVVNAGDGTRLSFSGSAFEGTAKSSGLKLCVRTGIGEKGVQKFGLTSEPLNNRYSKLKMRINRGATGPSIIAHIAQNYTRTSTRTNTIQENSTYTIPQIESSTISYPGEDITITNTASRTSQYVSSSTLVTEGKTVTGTVQSTTKLTRSSNRTTWTMGSGTKYVPVHVTVMNSDILDIMSKKSMSSGSLLISTSSMAGVSSQQILSGKRTSNLVGYLSYLTKVTTSNARNTSQIRVTTTAIRTSIWSTAARAWYGRYNVAKTLTLPFSVWASASSITNTSYSFQHATPIFPYTTNLTTSVKTSNVTRSSTKLSTKNATRSSQYTSSSIRSTTLTSLRTSSIIATLTDIVTRTQTLIDTITTNNANI